MTNTPTPPISGTVPLTRECPLCFSVGGPCNSPTCPVLDQKPPNLSFEVGGETMTIGRDTFSQDSDTAAWIYGALRRMDSLAADLSLAAPAPVAAGSRQSTHWDGCWRDSGHHACAVAEIERMRSAPVAAAWREVTLEDAFNIKRDADGIPCLQSEAEDMLTALHSYGAVIRTDANDREPPHCQTCDCGPK